MFLWLRIICWILMVLMVIFAPSCYRSDSRRRLWEKLQAFCTALIGLPTTQPPDAAAAETASRRNTTNAQGDQFHYVISSTQEDEIRECFLIDRLRDYTKNIEDEDIIGAEDYVDPEVADENHLTQTSPVVRNNEGSVVEDAKASSSSDDDDDDDCSVDYCVDEMGPSAGFLLVPAPGDVNDSKTARQVPNGCSICLCPFEVDQKITWSSNGDCTHAFHHACILDWLKASGRRHCRRRRRQAERERVLNYANNPLLKITNFPMQCPCCRQVFVSSVEEEEEIKQESRSNVASTVASSSSSSSSSVGDEASEDLSSENGSVTMEVSSGSDDDTNQQIMLASPPSATNEENV